MEIGNHALVEEMGNVISSKIQGLAYLCDFDPVPELLFIGLRSIVCHGCWFSEV